MLKTLIFGFLFGIVGTVTAAYYVPVVDQYRESSVISVFANGGNTESFHINIPTDRIMIGAPGQAEPVPPGLQGPADAQFEGVRKMRFHMAPLMRSHGPASKKIGPGETVFTLTPLPAIVWERPAA